MLRRTYNFKDTLLLEWGDTLNELYTTLQKVNTAANYVFEEQPAKRKLYRTSSKNKKRI